MITGKRIVVYGYGNIGKQLVERLSEAGCGNRLTVITRNPPVTKPQLPNVRFWNYERWGNEMCGPMDVTFVAIPTLDDGTSARNLILSIVQCGAPVITCEKGALANHFPILKQYLHRIGYGATVGGGSGLIHHLRSRFSSSLMEFHVILNGTLNYIWNELANGESLAPVVQQAKSLKIAEPGETDPFNIICQELVRDAPKKAAILLNLCCDPDPPMSGERFSFEPLEDRIERAAREACDCRFIVSFRRKGLGVRHHPRDIPVFGFTNAGWYMQGVFKHLGDPLVARLCRATPGVSNGILTVEGPGGSDGTSLCVGLGAGPVPTAAAMIRDAERLLGLTKQTT